MTDGSLGRKYPAVTAMLSKAVGSPADTVQDRSLVACLRRLSFKPLSAKRTLPEYDASERGRAIRLG